MTIFEILTLVVSLIAVLISAVALVKTQRLQEKQLAILERDETKKAQARVNVELVREDQSKYAFHITNVGEAQARNVEFELVDCQDSPLVGGEYDRKLPAPLLSPGGTIRLLAARHSGSPLAYTAKAYWTNPDGQPTSAEFYLTM